MSAVMILVLSAMHFCAAVFVFAAAFGRGMRRFDRGGEEIWIDYLVDWASHVLWFPGWQIARAADVHHNALEWLLLLGTSLLWGIFLFLFFASVYLLTAPTRRQP